jgi:GNAT superfamily N-acetyltransferase
MAVQVSAASTVAEREEVFHQRYLVYTQEMNRYREQADDERQLLSDPDDAGAALLAARVDGEVVGSMRVHVGAESGFPEEMLQTFELERFTHLVPMEQMAVVSRFTVLPRFRNQRVPFSLIIASVEYMLDHGVQLAFLDCVPHLINLYLSLGFFPYAHNVRNSEVGFLVPMVLILRDLPYLAQIRSPLASTVAARIGRAEPPSWAEELMRLPATVTSERIHGDDYWSKAYAYLTERPKDQNDFFQGLTEEETRLALESGHIIQCEPGEQIIKQGTTGTNLFVVLSGAVRVSQGDRMLAILQAGEILGEVAYLAGVPRSADVFAETDDVRILSIDEKVLNRIIRSHPEAATKLLLNLSRILCKRLIGTQAQ